MFRLNHLFKQADAVQRYLAAPLTRSRLAYLAHRAEQGARSSTLRGDCRPPSQGHPLFGAW